MRGVLLICRFRVPESDRPGFVVRANTAVALLSRADGCSGADLGRSVDDPERWVLTARFASVVAYRRALSPFEVRVHVVPLLAEALADEPATYETLSEARSGRLTEHPSLLAGDRPDDQPPSR